MGSFAAERRRLVVGISHHLVGADLADVLKRMSATDPSLVIELRIESSRVLLSSL